MSHFTCQHCGTDILEGENGRYVTECEHYPIEPDIDKCPNCGGPADNGFDRCIPPNPYFCSKCAKLGKIYGDNF